MRTSLIAQPGPAEPGARDADRADTWRLAREALSGLPGGRGLNIAHEAVDRHVAERGDHVALRWLGRRGQRIDLTYAELAERTSRFANVLTQLDVTPGDVVATLLGRVPDMHVAALGALKHRSVVTPLFSAFGPEPVWQRLSLAHARVLVTTPLAYHRKVAPLRPRLPDLRHVLLVGDDDEANGDDLLSLSALMADAGASFVIPPTEPEELALLHFTSGTTGTPKGAMHVHEAVVAHHATGASALDLRADDVFWCTADPGWVTGTSYGIVAPLTHGVTAVVDEGDLDARRWYGILQDEHVTVWYTAPTAVRMLMRAGTELPRRHDLSALRVVASVGEPLNAEAVLWGREALGRDIHDTWWQTETGAIMIASPPDVDVRPGSMGRPLPGVEGGVLARDARGDVRVDDRGAPVLAGTGEVGELALREGWPSMFRGYLDDEARYRRCFLDGWYLTGDLVRVDPEGWFWFVGRGDDVIKSAGHLIGPFEVESALLEHPSVAEAGVIGVPDALAGELVKAFVTLHDGVEPSDELRQELLAFARKRLGPAVAPRSVEFARDLPRTRSGKILRRLLRARELGLPEGDLSTLEPSTQGDPR